MILSGFVVAALSAAPMADVWPFRGQRLADGSIEYVYDLTALKASSGFADAKEANGEEAVKQFLAKLPRQVTVKVPVAGPLSLTSGQGLENAPLAVSFATSPDGPLATDDPLGKKPGARLLAPLDPRTPKVLVGVEVPLLLARTVEDSALAAVEVDTEWMRRELWTKVAEKAIAKAKTGSGDAREGAFALAARVLAANSCLDATKLPPAVKAEAELKTAIDAEYAKLTSDSDSLVAPNPWSSSPELSCAWQRGRALARPFEQSRAGTAAVLVFLEILGKDPKLQALFDRVRQRRDAFLGSANETQLAAFKAAAKGDPGAALEGLNEFIEALPLGERTPPPLMAWPSTPFTKFLSELTGAERGAALDELSAAVGDGRVSPSGSSWPVARDAALAALLHDSSKAVQIDSGWRDRLGGVFAAFQGAHREASRGGLEADDEVLERTQLELRLNVPPFLELEPVPLVFRRAARSLEALAAALAKENLTGLRGVSAEQRRSGEPIVAETKRLVPLLDGLASLSSMEGAVEGKGIAEARRFLAGWRADPLLGRDLRSTSASAFASGSERAHAAIVGVSRRELRVGWTSAPKPTIVGEAKGFVLNAAVEQRFLVPVMVTLGANAPHTLKPADRTKLKQLIDAAGRQPTKIEGTLQEALHPEAVAEPH